MGGSLLAVARNRALVRLLTAFCSFTAYEQIAWVAVLPLAYAEGGVALAGLVRSCSWSRPRSSPRLVR